MYINKLIISISTVAALCACNSSSDPATSSDPLATFEPIAKACAAALATPRAEQFYESAGKWKKIVYSPNVVKFDVRKTESLVSPYLAEINLTYDDVTLSSDTRAQAETANVNNASVNLSASSKFRFFFANQNNQWKLQRIETTVQIKTGILEVDNAINAPVEISREELTKKFPEAIACLTSPVA